MDIDAAARSLSPDIQKDINWFAEPGEKNFVDPVSVGLIGMGLLKLFGAAVLTGAGEEVGKQAVVYVRDLMHRRKTVEPAALTDEIAQARASLAAAPPEEAEQRLAQAQGDLAEQFSTVMPRPRAVRLAERIGTASRPLLDAGA